MNVCESVVHLFEIHKRQEVQWTNKKSPKGWTVFSGDKIWGPNDEFGLKQSHWEVLGYVIVFRTRSLLIIHKAFKLYFKYQHPASTDKEPSFCSVWYRQVKIEHWPCIQWHTEYQFFGIWRAVDVHLRMINPQLIYCLIWNAKPFLLQYTKDLGSAVLHHVMFELGMLASVKHSFFLLDTKVSNISKLRCRAVSHLGSIWVFFFIMIFCLYFASLAWPIQPQYYSRAYWCRMTNRLQTTNSASKSRFSQDFSLQKKKIAFLHASWIPSIVNFAKVAKKNGVVLSGDIRRLARQWGIEGIIKALMAF